MGNPLFSRRQFLTATSSLAAAASVAGTLDVGRTSGTSVIRTEKVSLDGSWQFRLDPDDLGRSENWEKAGGLSEGWSAVTVPHTWQTSPVSAGYFGIAWYRKEFEVRPSWNEETVRVEFEAVFHSATVWINGQEARKHTLNGLTWMPFRTLRPKPGISIFPYLCATPGSMTFAVRFLATSSRKLRA